jgi:hypothetical protein
MSFITINVVFSARERDLICEPASRSSDGEVSHDRVLSGRCSVRGTLSLLILEFVKEANKEHRWIRIASITAAGLNETLWALPVQRRSEEQRHR